MFRVHTMEVPLPPADHQADIHVFINLFRSRGMPTMPRSLLYRIVLLRRIVLSICDAHLGAISGSLLWLASYNPPKDWHFTSIIINDLFYFAGTFSFLLAVISFSSWAPFILGSESVSRYALV